MTPIVSAARRRIKRYEPADCVRLADLASGMGDAALRSLVSKELVAPNLVRKGLSKKPDGTYSITPAGRAAFA